MTASVRASDGTAGAASVADVDGALLPAMDGGGRIMCAGKPYWPPTGMGGGSPCMWGGSGGGGGGAPIP